jgi:hypothetical protein
MGDAKRRQQLDPTFGVPIVFELTVHPAQLEEEILAVPFQVKRRSTALETLQAAQATAIAIVGQLATGAEDWEVDVQQSLGQDAREMLADVRSDCPESLWAGLHCPDGDTWYFASDKDALPESVAIASDWHEFKAGDVVRRAA